MKINTKTATPVKDSPHSFLNENKFIPSSAMHISNTADDDDAGKKAPSTPPPPPSCGRTILYETVVVSTPILASARIQNNGSHHHLTTTTDAERDSATATKRLLTKDEVDALNTMLNSLYLDNRRRLSESVKKAIVVAKKEEVPALASPASLSTTTFLGRCRLAIYSAKTNDFIEVWRSARLAFKAQ